MPQSMWPNANLTIYLHSAIFITIFFAFYYIKNDHIPTFFYTFACQKHNIINLII